jgi:hypothetical protein
MDAQLDDLPLNWQLLAKAILARRQQQLELYSQELDQLRAVLNGRRSRINRLLGQGTPRPDFTARRYYYEDEPVRGSRHADRREESEEENTDRLAALHEILRELARETSEQPALSEVNHELRALGFSRITPGQLSMEWNRLRRSW